MKTLIYLFFALALIYLNSCEDRQERRTVYMSDEMKSYIMQPLGSWWVYQDSATLEIDTVHLAIQEIELAEDMNAAFPYKYEKIKNIYSGTRKIRRTYYSQTYGDSYIYNKLSEKKICYMGDAGAYGDFMDVGEKKGTITYVAFFDSIQIKDKIYFNIKVFDAHLGDENDGFIFTFYMARNIGVIRKQWKLGILFIEDLMTYELKQQ